MNQDQRIRILIEDLLKERQCKTELPSDKASQEKMLRALVNIRMPMPSSKSFISLQNEYLQERLRRKKITDIKSLTPIQEDIYVWQGDITTLKCDAIVNAANSKMLGCFCPNHGCIDNAIHTYAGVELRFKCAQMMQELGREAKTGETFLTSAYNLPSTFIIHIVGPIVFNEVTEEHRKLLEECYFNCLKLAEERGLNSIAFCCISTGEFHFPNLEAARIAIETVKKFKRKTNSRLKVIFNVFKKEDYAIYKKLLQ